MTLERAYWLAWAQISGLGPVLLKRILDYFGSLEEAWQAQKKELIEVGGLGHSVIEGIVETRNKLEPQEFFQKHLQDNPNFWTPADLEYPRLLLEIPSLPSVLYYSGQVSPEENQGNIPCVTIVGTRSPTQHGRRWAKKISQTLAQAGFTIVSSMAAGLDGEAQQSVLEVDGRTIAILGTGVDLIYPHSARQLHQNIQKKGLLLSEYPKGTKGEKGNFIARNRLLAGLSRAVIVIEASETSGCLSTARYANEFGRDVYVLPNSPEVEEARGCLKLLREGAEMILSAEELLTFLGGLPAITPTTNIKESSPELPEDLKRVWQSFSQEIVSFDQVVNNSSLSASQVSAALLQLELLGLVQQLPGMRYQRS